MAKGKKRHKNCGRYGKVLVLEGFVHDKQLELYKYVIRKYLSDQVAPLLDVTIKDLPDHEALAILDAEDYNSPRVRVKDES